MNIQLKEIGSGKLLVQQRWPSKAYQVFSILSAIFIFGVWFFGGGSMPMLAFMIVIWFILLGGFTAFEHSQRGPHTMFDTTTNQVLLRPSGLMVRTKIQPTILNLSELECLYLEHRHGRVMLQTTAGNHYQLWSFEHVAANQANLIYGKFNLRKAQQIQHWLQRQGINLPIQEDQALAQTNIDDLITNHSETR